MTERDVHALRVEALATLAAATRAANDAPDVESTLGHLTAATQEVLGDKEAHLRPGGLRAGERQFVVSCIFLITADRQHNLLVAEHGFPPEQHRLRIPLDFGPPGWVVQHQRPRIIANTDEAPDFRQILKTSHMGSTLYGPMFWRGQMLGQALTVAQARNTYGPIDLDIFMSFAHVAAAVYMAHGGPAWLRTADPRGYGPWMTKHERFWDGNVLHGPTKHTCKPRAESVCQGRIERGQLSAALTPLPVA